MLGASLKLLVFSVWLFGFAFGLAFITQGTDVGKSFGLFLFAAAGGSLLLAGLTNILGLASLLFKKWD